MSTKLSAEIAEFQSVHKALKAGDASLQLRADYKALETSVESGLCLVFVTPDRELGMIHRQLIGADLVHSLGTETLERLKTMRLGYEGNVKQAFVLANPENWKVYSGIYSHQSNQPVGLSGLVSPRDVPGKADKILNEQQTWLEQFNTAVCYSVVNMGFVPGAKEEDYLPGVARMMIRSIRGHYKDDVEGVNTLATLSPFRKFGAYFENMQDMTGQSDEQVCLQALRFILNNADLEPTMRDDVMNFHLGNGAEVFDINLRANAKDSFDARDGANVMINYQYPLQDEKLSENQRQFKAGVVGIAPHLADLIARRAPESQGATVEGAPVYVPGC